MTNSHVNAPTEFLQTNKEKYAYRRFGTGKGVPLVLLQHFTGTLDNWDPLVTDGLAESHDVILFDNAGVGRSTGKVPSTMQGMAEHVLAFLDALRIETCDLFGFSLGGMVAQQIALDRPALVRKLILAGTAPRGGEDIMHLDKPSIGKHFQDPTLKGYDILQKIFFAPTQASQTAGKAFTERLMQRQKDREPLSGGEVAQSQMAAFREWEQFTGERFGELKRVRQPALVVNGVHDDMVPIANSYRLVENLPNAFLLAYPDAGHGSIFQWHDSFVRQATAFLASKSSDAPY
jgi:pimeloyl-ACP methyl ester carboxylesterase